MTLGADLVRGLVDLVFAPVCIACEGAVSPGLRSDPLCPGCRSRLRAIPPPRCERCWHPRPPAPTPATVRESCSLCQTLPPWLRAVRSACLFDAAARDLVHALKFGGWRIAAPILGERMAAMALPLEVSEEVRLVVPVPLSGVRLRERGYNQAALLARDLAARLGWRCEDGLLLRARATARQATLHPDQRRANVAGAFRVRNGGEGVVRREHVLVVDDVWTTGATALACAATLIASGARAVSVATFARALPEMRH